MNVLINITPNQRSIATPRAIKEILEKVRYLSPFHSCLSTSGIRGTPNSWNDGYVPIRLFLSAILRHFRQVLPILLGLPFDRSFNLFWLFFVILLDGRAGPQSPRLETIISLQRSSCYMINSWKQLFHSPSSKFTHHCWFDSGSCRSNTETHRWCLCLE